MRKALLATIALLLAGLCHSSRNATVAVGEPLPRTALMEHQDSDGTSSTAASGDEQPDANEGRRRADADHRLLELLPRDAWRTMLVRVRRQGRNVDGGFHLRSTIANLVRDLRGAIDSKSKVYEALWALQNLRLLDVVAGDHKQPVTITVKQLGRDHERALVAVLERAGRLAPRRRQRFCRALEKAEATDEFLTDFDTVFSGSDGPDLLRPGFLKQTVSARAPYPSPVSSQTGDGSSKPETDRPDSSVSGIGHPSPVSGGAEARNRRRIGRPASSAFVSSVVSKPSESGATSSDLPVVPARHVRKSRRTRMPETLDLDRWRPWNDVKPELEAMFGAHAERVPVSGTIQFADHDPRPLRVLAQLAKDLHVSGVKPPFEDLHGPVAVARILRQYIRLHRARPEAGVLRWARTLMRRLDPALGNPNRMTPELMIQVLGGYVLRRTEAIHDGKLPFGPTDELEDIYQPSNVAKNRDAWRSARNRGTVTTGPLEFLASLPDGVCVMPTTEVPDDAPETSAQFVAEFEREKPNARRKYDDINGEGTFDTLPFEEQFGKAMGPEALASYLATEKERGR